MKWEETLGRLIFGDSGHLMSACVLSQLPNEKIHSDLGLSPKKYTLFDMATCSGSPCSIRKIDSFKDFGVSHQFTISRFSLLPPVLAAVASGCSYQCSLSFLGNQDDLFMQGAATGLIGSASRFVISSVQPRWIPTTLGNSVSDFASFGVYCLSQRSRYAKMRHEGIITEAQEKLYFRKSLLASLGGLIGSRSAHLLFGDSGAANLAGSLAGTYFATHLI